MPSGETGFSAVAAIVLLARPAERARGLEDGVQQA
jgi:hypothetical protein